MLSTYENYALIADVLLPFKIAIGVAMGFFIMEIFTKLTDDDDDEPDGWV